MSSVVYGGSVSVSLTGVNATGYSVVLLDKSGNKVRDLTVSNGKVSVDASALAVGEYSIKATTVVGDNHNSAIGSAKLTVTKAGSSVTVPVSSVVYGGSVSVSLTGVNATGYSAVLLDKSGNKVRDLSVSNGKVVVLS